MAKGPKGERHLCGACGQWHEPHMPDNCTFVPVCTTCWGQIGFNARVFALTLSRASTCIENLDRTIFEGIDGAILKLVEARMKEMNKHSDN